MSNQKRFYQLNWNKILELENFLGKHQYFSKECLPGIADALMFQIFDKEFPNKKKFPCLYFWYVNIKQFSPQTINNWSIKSEKDIYFLEFLNKYQQMLNKQQTSSKTAKSDKNQKNQNQNFPSAKNYEDYSLAVRLKQFNERTVCTLRRNIQKKSYIVSCQFLGDLMKLKIKCDAINIQLIKGDLERSRTIIRYQVKKQKMDKKLSRIARTNTFHAS